jgi:NDP-sugar pyrophosphorylase family protein
MSDRAVVLAGGRGTRLQPYTVVLPKPLMPLGDCPILEILIRQLARYGFRHVTLAVNHQADIIRAFFGDGAKWKIQIDYSFESEPLSTIAPLRLVRDLPEDFLLLNGDVLTDLNFAKLYEEHVRQGRLFTIAGTSRQQRVDYGVLNIDTSANLIGFREKPVLNYLVSMGIYAVNRAVVSAIPSDRKYGVDDLIADLLARGETIHVRPHEGYWLDIGRADDYLQAIEDFERRKELFLSDG